VNNKNKMSNLGYQLGTIKIQLMLFLLLNIYIIFIISYKNEKIMRIILIK